MSRRLPTLTLLVVWTGLAAGLASAENPSFDLGGRVSPQVRVTSYPDDSLLHDLFGATSTDCAFDARVVLGVEHGRWSLDIDSQLIGIYADSLEASRRVPDELRGLLLQLPNDDERFMDLTSVLNDRGKSASLLRLDRLAVGFTTDNFVMKLGRQAITWGNGLVYNVMDIFNPFDPTAVDKEYKTGDDMLYGQYLHPSGDDVQGVMVIRRDPVDGEVASDRGSLAFKYHHMASVSELDALLAWHYDEALVGAGFNWSIGGSVWRGDLVVTFTDDDTVPSLVTSLSHSWTWGGTNVSGGVEYFYNGFGLTDGCYAAACLASHPDLTRRITRGELFTLARHYLSLSAVVEVTPLFLVTPNLFVNLADPSALVQVLLQNDLRQDMVLWTAINLPVGASGTEFGGPASPVPGRDLSAGPSLSMQLVWYW